LSPPLSHDLASRVGFSAAADEGESIVPAVVGPSTAFNAQGREVIRKDLPMETRSRMIHTSWQDWHGQTHHGTQFRDYQAYPRELVPPPGEYLTLVKRGEDLIASSRTIRNDEAQDTIVNLLNVFLELFGTLEIVQPDLSAAVQVRRVNWRILPPGEYPYARAAEALSDYLQKLPPDAQEIAKVRVRAITRHKPDFIAVGVGGFSDYVVFGFTAKRRFVLESPQFGNATYIFRDDWQRFATLTKAEIIQGNLQEARLVHNKRWSRTLHEAIERH
jgi:hypothetical protein